MQGYSVMRLSEEPAPMDPTTVGFESTTSSERDKLDAAVSSSDEEAFSIEDSEYYVAYTPVCAVAPLARLQDVKRADYEMRLGLQQSTVSRRRHLIRAYEAHKYDHFEHEGASDAALFVKRARDPQHNIHSRRRYWHEAMRRTNNWPEKRRLKQEFNAFYALHRASFAA